MEGGKLFIIQFLQFWSRKLKVQRKYKVIGSPYFQRRIKARKLVINSCAKSAWCARRQHSYNICKDFLSHNSWMKNLNFTKKYTDHKTINSNNYAKFEVNWPRGSQFTAWHTKNVVFNCINVPIHVYGAAVGEI